MIDRRLGLKLSALQHDLELPPLRKKAEVYADIPDRSADVHSTIINIRHVMESNTVDKTLTIMIG
jgi:hypothetical protein